MIGGRPLEASTSVMTNETCCWGSNLKWIMKKKVSFLVESVYDFPFLVVIEDKDLGEHESIIRSRHYVMAQTLGSQKISIQFMNLLILNSHRSDYISQNQMSSTMSSIYS
jgi:hypothetical protein